MNMSLLGWRALPFLAVFFFTACVTAPAPISFPEDTHTEDAGSGETTATSAEGAPNSAPPQGAFVPDSRFAVCPIRVRNAPPSEAGGNIPSYGQLFIVDGKVALATIPVNGACLSSGFGIRGSRLHKGIDISAQRGTWVYSAAPGIVRDAGWGGSFGYYILIDHGYGVFTRYAHLDAFVVGLEVGSELGFGWPIGQIGDTSTVKVGVHLHYELLIGDYNTPKLSFGLTAHDPFSFAVYVPPPIG